MPFHETRIRRRLFRISETRKLHVGDAAITSRALQHSAFIRGSLFAFAYPPAVLTGELQNFPIRIPCIQALLPNSRFWWTLSRFAPWSQCSTHPLASTFIISPHVLAAQAFARDIFLSSPPDGKRHRHPVKKPVA